MGYIAHRALVVTGYTGADQGNPGGLSDITLAHQAAVEFCGDLVSPLVQGRVNGDASFFVAPDCSKEGWADSDRGDQERDMLVAWLREQRQRGVYLDWAVVRYGGDNPEIAGVEAHEGDRIDDEADEATERFESARPVTSNAPALGGLLASPEASGLPTQQVGGSDSQVGES